MSKPKTILFRGLSKFCLDFSILIEARTKLSIKTVEEKNMSNRLKFTQKYREVEAGVIGELLFAYMFGGKSSNNIIGPWDVEVDGVKYDQKTMDSYQDLFRGSGGLNHNEFFLQKNQTKDYVHYIPVLLNVKQDAALIIVSEKLIGKNIIENKVSERKNPKYSKVTELIDNYIFRYSEIYFGPNNG